MTGAGRSGTARSRLRRSDRRAGPRAAIAVPVVALVAIALGVGGAQSLTPQGSTVARLFTVTFLESGLPARALWNLTIATHTWSTYNSSLAIPLANGSYAYSAYASIVLNESGPAAGHLNGSFAVNDQPQSVHLNWSYTAPASAPSAGPSGPIFPAGFVSIGAALALAAVLLVIVGLALGLVARRRRVTALPPIGGSSPEAPVSEDGIAPTESDPPDDPLGHML